MFFSTSAGREQRGSPGNNKGRAHLIHWILQEFCNKIWMVKTLNRSLFPKGLGDGLFGSPGKELASALIRIDVVVPQLRSVVPNQ